MTFVGALIMTTFLQTVSAGIDSKLSHFRFKDAGEDFCLTFIEKAPTPISVKGVMIRDLIIEHESLGTGTMQGSATFKNGITYGPLVITI